MPTIKQRTERYIIGKPDKIAANAVDFEFGDLINEIDNLNEVFSLQDTEGDAAEPVAKVERELKTRDGEINTLVVKMNNEIKEQLEKKHRGAILIEPDAPLFPLDDNTQIQTSLSPNIPEILNVVPTDESLKVTISVKGPNGEPVKKARVSLAGLLWVDSGFTNSRGQVKLTLLGETVDSMSSIEIKPAHTYWSFRIEQPTISEENENEIVLKKIGTEIPGDTSASEKQFVGWGQQDMGLVGQPPQSKTVRIAVIDSGIVPSHPDLSPSIGFDFGDTDKPEKTWRDDNTGHGTHVAGICSAKNNKLGILGFAPEADLVVLRIFPNALNSKLIEALQWCIDHDVDVINMSLGGKNGSEQVRQRLQACRENGILPIAAAGNNGSKVLFPAAFDEVIAVAAVGNFGSFPDDSAHRRHIGDKPIRSGDYFSPKFTCRGPEIDVCAPGVAITSCVPDNGIAAWDGTSMASPHVAGLAARLLQMRDDLHELPRTSERSQALFDSIIGTCVFLDGIPSIYQGNGMPHLPQGTGGTTGKQVSLEEVSQLIDKAITIVEEKLVNT
jgi:hypothetical protein